MGLLSFLFGHDSPPPPDYRPIAQASREAAQIMAQLGREQLAENRRQYDLNRQALQPVLQQMLSNMRQTSQQGANYFDYLKRYSRPAEKVLFAEAYGLRPDELAAVDRQQLSLSDIARRAGTVSSQRQEYDAAKAIADARAATTQQQNQLIRQALRYGWSPERVAALAALNTGLSVQNQVRAANQARLQREKLDWAKRMDVAGLYRNLPGASTGAYTAATRSASAAQNAQMVPSQQYMHGLNQGIDTIYKGQGLKLQGLDSILRSQADYAKAYADSGVDIGGLMQGAAALYTAFSDIAVKKDLKYLGRTSEGIPIYKFRYIWGGPEYIGVIAQDVEKIKPEAVINRPDGLKMVDYSKLRI